MSKLEELKMKVREELPYSIELLKSICYTPPITAQKGILRTSHLIEQFRRDN
jgi:hypothetical protein